MFPTFISSTNDGKAPIAIIVMKVDVYISMDARALKGQEIYSGILLLVVVFVASSSRLEINDLLGLMNNCDQH